MILELSCADTEQWSITDGHGTCPDCAALIVEISIAAHVRWHQTLVCQLLEVCANQDQSSNFTIEPNLDEPGECVRLLHDLQIARLREGR